MIRILLASTLPILGLTLAGALIGPSVGMRAGGEPMLVAAASEGAAMFQRVDAAANPCATTLLLSNGSAAAVSSAELRAVALVLRGKVFEMQDVSASPTPDGAALVLLLDDAGAVTAMLDPAAFDAGLLDEMIATRCSAGSPTREPAGAI